MSTPTLDDVRDLMARTSPCCVSVFMPTHRHGRETAQDPVRLKNLLGRAEEELRALGLRRPDTDAVLDPGRELLQDTDFWRHRQGGIALFFAPDWHRTLSTPVGLEETVVVGGRFHVRPLLNVVWPDRRFHILALSQAGARLMAATRYTVQEVEVPGLPQGIGDILGLVETERQLQSHVALRRGDGRAGGSVAYHGHGLGREAADERVLEYFRAVDQAVAAVVRPDDAPLVLATAEQFLPLYREVTTIPTVLDAAVPGNPDLLSEEELQRKAWDIVASLAEQDTDRLLAAYQERAAKGGAAHSLELVLRGAQAARVETLFVPADAAAVWGRFDAAGGKARYHQSRRAGDEDLIDRAAVETIRHGGSVVPLPAERLPHDSTIAAIMRY